MKNRTTTFAALALWPCAFFLFCWPLLVHGQSKEQAHVDSLESVIDSMVFNGNIKQAFQQSNELSLYTAEHFGERSIQHGKVLLDHARLMLMTGSSHDALAQALKAQTIIASKQGISHADYALSLHVCGVCHFNLADLDNAEKCHIEALSIREKLFGRASAECGASLNSLGAVSSRRNDYTAAEQYMLEVKAIREKIYGREHSEYASIVSNLGLLYYYMGAYETAEKNLKEALTVRENTQGIYNPDYAGTLNNLGMVYEDLGQHQEAELCYQKGLHIREYVLGREHPAFAEGLNNLSGFYFKTGNFEKAMTLMLEAQSVWAKQYGKEHPEYLKSKSGIALLKEQLGKPYEAMKDLEELVEILQKDTASNMRLLLDALPNLGQLYANGSDFQKAESIFLQALALTEKTPNESLGGHADLLKRLGSLYLEKGDLAKSETNLLESKNEIIAALGEQSIELIYLNNLLAKLRFRQGNMEAALELQAASNHRVETELKNAAQYLSEHELDAYAKQLSMGGDATFTFALEEMDFAALCYDHSLFYKGFVLQSAYQLRSLANKNPEAKATASKLTQHRRRLASEYVKPFAERDNAAIAGLEDAANNFEKELARTVAGYEQAFQQCTWQQVQQALSPSEAAIEFVRFSKNQSSDADSVFYAAMVLRPGQAKPAFVPLCEEKHLNDLLRKRKSRRSDYVNDLYSSESTQLYDLIWKSMEPSLQGVKTIYYSPSGLLFRLNLAAIPVDGKQDETLADRHHFVQLGSTRQLAIKAVPQALVEKSALVYGGVIYDPATSAVPIDTAAAEILASRSRGELDFSTTDSTLRGGSWSYLGWTEKEAEAIRSSLSASGFKILLQSGLQATEEQFKSMGNPEKMTVSPQVIHLATHGYFFPDPGSAGSSQLAVRGLGEPVFKTSDQPMIRSGLILAGGNHAWKTGKPLRPDLEDGILTAYEISQMDLSGTELVVLSACETGLGDIDGNEGVYGLQRAFKIAGAKYLVMSLWQVPDQQTQELMAAFYENWLTKEMNIPDAFRAAQQSVRERYEHPFFWAGFVLVE